jgi:acetolactate synthase-1/2/3 large subunit
MMARSTVRRARPGLEPDILAGGAIVWRTLERLGVSHVFGYPGGAILPTYDALAQSSIRHVLVRHEQGAAHMADGFARSTGRVGVAMATSGPGATNLVTGIATAMMDSSPIVCITGQVNSGQIGFGTFQEVDITGITLPITKHNYQVTDPADVAPVLREAFEIAASGRPGPVLVDLTKDAQQGTAAFDWEAAAPRRRARQAPRPSAAGLDAALALVAGAQRPLILAGHGILLSGAADELRAFVDRTGIPVVTTLLGIGALPASHPLAFGMIGMHGEAWANQAVQQADLLIALGVRFDDRAVGAVPGFAPGARKIHVEIDAAEIDKIVRADVALHGDVREVLAALRPRAPKGGRPEWVARIEAARREAGSRDILRRPDTGTLHGPHVIDALSRQAGGDAVIVTDVGQNQMWEAQYYRHERPRSLITSGGLGTMGFALPAAIGAKLARPDAEVWAVAGDGGIQMTMAELATVRQEQLPLKIAVLNNSCLGMVRQLQEVSYGGRYQATPLSGPDFCAVARAYGIEARLVTTRAEVAPAIRDARRHAGPMLVEFRVEADDCVYPMVPNGASLHQMIRRPRQWPRRVAPAGRGA